MKVLVIDDEKNYTDAMIRQLQAEGYSAKAAYNYKEADEVLSKESFDCVLCDYELDKTDLQKHGEKLVRTIREKSIHTPVIFMTGKTLDRVTPWGLLDAGGDDFLHKPVRPQELVARIKALHRRSQPANTDSVVSYPPLQLDLNKQKVFMKDQELVMSRTQFLLVLYFFKNPNKVIPYKDIISYLRGEEVDVDEDSMGLLRVHMHNLKTIFRKARISFLHNVHGEGYIFDTNKILVH